MAWVLLDHSDGPYSTRPLSDEEAAKLEAQVANVALVEDRVLAAWHRHCDESSAWQALWRALANDLYIRRRERALLPLEDAAREIEHLKEELARVKSYFEDAAGHQPRTEHAIVDDYTCIFPQPGCDISVLESAEWRASAVEILEKYNVKLGEEGGRYQGCCCGHRHLRISSQAAARLRAAGFLVENDSEETP